MIKNPFESAIGKKENNEKMSNLKNIADREKGFKNLELILFLLKKIPGFIRFIKYNEVKDEVLVKVLPFLKHVSYEKGSIIFKEGDSSTQFYIVVRGRISLRVKKPKKKPNPIEQIKERSPSKVKHSNFLTKLIERKTISKSTTSKAQNKKKLSIIFVLV